ncbi:hypothetical protein MTO96_031243 [Rhipicephalus appendiculatus]
MRGGGGYRRAPELSAEARGKKKARGRRHHDADGRPEAAHAAAAPAASYVRRRAWRPLEITTSGAGLRRPPPIDQRVQRI